MSYCCGNEVLSPAHDMNAKLLVFLPLLSRNPTGELVGRLARSWEASPDLREWTYHLRTDVRWHDGEPFTAADVAFTAQLMEGYEDPDYGAGAFESVTVHDDSTVTFRTRGPRRSYQQWMVFYPRHLLNGQDPSTLPDWEFWRRPVGNGPYRFVRLEPETMMEFEANPDFYAGRPSIERVILRFSLDAGVTELLSGAVDVIETNPAAVRDDPRFRVYHAYSPVSWVIYWKSDHPLFADVRVRRALTLAIDRRTLAQAVDIPDDVPLFDGPYTAEQSIKGPFPPPPVYDPERAAELLREAGWKDEDGDGVLDRDGRQFRFAALVRARSSENLSGLETLAVFVQSQLRSVGVRMDVLTVDPAVVNARLDAGKFEAVFHFLRPYPARPWLERYRFGEGLPLGYLNPRVAELIDRTGDPIRPLVEDSLYAELAEIFRRDVPVTFLHPVVGFTVAHRRLVGLSSPWRTDPVVHMDELRIEDVP